MKHLKIPVEASGGIGEFGTNSFGLRNEDGGGAFSGSFWCRMGQISLSGDLSPTPA